MKIYTLNVGQGQFVVVTGDTEAIIVDTSVSLSPKEPIINVKSALVDILKGKNLIGVMITGFDDDHFNEVGIKIALNKYRPNWIMYPKYFKKTKTADACFRVIESFEANGKFKRVSVLLDDNDTRFYNKLSDDFKFEVFSPHAEDMGCSNNCSLVCKITERSTNSTYLVTGDTENSRWENIVEIFDYRLKSDALAAPHHGSENGITESAIEHINPHTVLISAGVDNEYGHPGTEALKIFRKKAKRVYSTSASNGQSLVTEITRNTISTTKYTVSDSIQKRTLQWI